jgi:hypothetical protein
MGRPPLRKSGAMTAAERQRRHRHKVKAERRQAEMAVARERSAVPFRDPEDMRAKAERATADGYLTEPVGLSDEQLLELATLLGIEVSAMEPLVQAGTAIWQWGYANPVSLKKRESAKKDALARCGQDLATAVEAVRGLDWPARLAVLKEYGYRNGDDYDELNLEEVFENDHDEPDLEKVFEEALERASHRNNDALRQLQADLRAAANLAQALTVAARRIEVKAGQPEKVDVRVAAEKIIEAYEEIAGTHFVNSQSVRRKGNPRRFVMRALDMLDYGQAEASVAIKRWCDRRPKTEKELPRDCG